MKIKLLLLAFVFVLFYTKSEAQTDLRTDYMVKNKAKTVEFKSKINNRMLELGLNPKNKVSKKQDQQRRYLSLVHYRLNNFNPPVGTTPETVALYESLRVLLGSMREINRDINFLNIEITDGSQGSSKTVKITNAYGENTSYSEAMSDLYDIKARIRALAADRAAVGLAITSIVLKTTSGVMQAVAGALSGNSNDVSEGASIAAALMADLGMNSKSINDLSKFIKSETDKREALIDKTIEDIKAVMNN